MAIPDCKRRFGARGGESDSRLARDRSGLGQQVARECTQHRREVGGHQFRACGFELAADPRIRDFVIGDLGQFRSPGFTPCEHLDDEFDEPPDAVVGVPEQRSHGA